MIVNSDVQRCENVQDRVLYARNHKIDILRFLGTLTIILAHVGAPSLIQNIRSFDVILLCVLSGYSTKNININSMLEYKKYVLKRIKRLLIPTYILIFVWYFGMALVCMIADHSPIYDWKNLLNALFLTHDDIGYVWVVKFYIFGAIFAPVVKKMKVYLYRDAWIVGACCLLTVIYSIVAWLYKDLSSFSNIFFKVFIEEYIIAGFLYLLVYVIGMTFNKSNKCVCGVLLFSVVGFCVSLALNNFAFIPNEFKYPPQAMYVFYGLLITTILLIVIPNKKFMIVEWISKNSFTIYLVHAVFVLSSIFISNWICKYIYVVVLSILCTYILNKLLDKIKIKIKSKKKSAC